MRIHIIEGDDGCRFAEERAAVAIIVDALRASATAAALLEANAAEVCVVKEVSEAFALKEVWPAALLFGERGGIPPEGFDFGNSPREASHARDRQVIFTTTTGAGRLLAARNAAAAFMASTVNSASVVQYLKRHPATEVVIIPAGLMGDPDFDAQEDWAAAAWIASQLYAQGDYSWGEGYERYCQVKEQLDTEGVEACFLKAPHADKLRAVGLEADIPLCARVDCYRTLPVATKMFYGGLLIKDASKETIVL